ncbi:MAG TPA: protein kinase, partial [Ktedonobacteraceae bacterium]|nr:protein kinase [Ktedonobacteraceae bacterium]
DFSPKQEQEFRKEAHIITDLHHEHIIRVLDYDVWQEPDSAQRRPYIVMTYAPLGSMRDRNAYPEGETVPPEKISLYIKQIADALHYAHNQENSVVHCDVKPENMLRVSQDHLILTDFGIAKDHHSTIEIPHIESTQPGVQKVFGTPGYMPPERCIGGPVSRSGDQYALAIVTYEWLVGRRPFEGKTSLEILTKQATLPPPSLRSRVPTISQGVEDVVMKALAHEISDRYSSISEFATALSEQLLASVNSGQTPPRPQRQQPAATASPRPPRQQVQPVAAAAPPIPQQAQPIPAASPVPQQAQPAAAVAPPIPPQIQPAPIVAPNPPKQQVQPAPIVAPNPPKQQVQPAPTVAMGGSAGQPGKQPPFTPRAGSAPRQQQGQIHLGGNAPGGYSATTFGNPPASQQQQSTTSVLSDVKSLWMFNPFGGLRRWMNKIEWLKRDPPGRYSQRPRTFFPLVNRMCIVLVAILLAFLTLPYGPIICILLVIFLDRFLAWARYLVKPPIALFFLSWISLYYAIGLSLIAAKLLPAFSALLGIQAVLIALPVFALFLSFYRNSRYIKLMHRQ